MQTKRCAYCHKLQRAGSRVCSRCGHSFEHYWSRTRRTGASPVPTISSGRSWSKSSSLFSLPAASPHRVGHYSGLHPEDQPYQSQIMVTPQRFIEEMREKKALQQEPKHIVLPSVPNVATRRRGSSQAPTRSSFPLRRARRRLISRNTLLENQGTFDRDMQSERGQISRPFVQVVRSTRAGASPAPTSAIPARASSVPAEGIAATYDEELELEDLGLTEEQEWQNEQYADLPLEDSLFSITSNSAPSVSDLPAYMQEALRTKPWPSRLISTILVSISFCVLLATSIGVFVLMNNHPGSVQAHKAPTPTSEVQTSVATPTHVQITTSQATPDGPAPAQLSISTTNLTYFTAQSQSPDSQVIIIRNTGGQALRWDATTHATPSWLILSLYHGMIPPGVGQPITVSVASQSLAIGTYIGSISFTGDAQVGVQIALTVLAPGNLVITPSNLALTTQQANQTLSLQNNGGFSLDWTVQPSTTWLSVTPSSGTLAPGESVTLTIDANATTLAPGTYQGTLTFSVGDQTQQVAVSFAVPATTPTPTPTSVPTSTAAKREASIMHSVLG